MENMTSSEYNRYNSITTNQRNDAKKIFNFILNKVSTFVFMFNFITFIIMFNFITFIIMFNFITFIFMLRIPFDYPQFEHF
jgi:hypothetical protein